MSIEQTVRDITREEGRGSIALWFAVLGSPLAWFSHLGFSYSLEEWFACSPSATEPGEILGIGVDAMSFAFNTLMALVALASGLTAVACWRRLSQTSDGDTWERERWLAFAGMVVGALFLAAILVGYLPPLVLDTCTGSP